MTRPIRPIFDVIYPQITGNLEDERPLIRAVLLLAHFTGWSREALLEIPSDEFDIYCEVFNEIMREMAEDEWKRDLQT